jgi:transposase
MSQWLYASLKEEGLAVELLETRHARAALKTMPAKTDRNDARGIAQLMRLGRFRPVHCKTVASQETRAVLTARKLVLAKLYDIEMSLRGTSRGFGLKVGRTTKAGFAGRIGELVEHHPVLSAIAKALLAVHAVLLGELNGFEKQVRKQAKGDSRVRLLMTTPGVGPIVGLSQAAAIDDPGRFSSSKTVGAHFGLTPKGIDRGRRTLPGGSPRWETGACAPRFSRPRM